MKRHAWGHEKASLVLGNETRGGVGFEECVAAIEDNRILDIVENENYSGQKMYVLDINNYAYVVPFVESEDEIFLKTMFPSRKFTKRYLRQQMAKEPTIGNFLDDEERQLYEAIEADDSAFKSVLTQAERERHRAIAKATLDDERIQISLRVSKRNLSKLKARALREGMPYQTLINSILHKAVN